MAESSWPDPAAGREVTDSGYEKLGASYGSYGGMVGDFTSPVVYGDSSGMQVKIADDRYALVRGHMWWSGSTVTTLPISANASGSTRSDLVVLRLTRATWQVRMTVITGTPGAGVPAATNSLDTTGLWDLPVAVVTVASGAATITAGNVTYVAPHLGSDGRMRSNGPSYMRHPYLGEELVTSDGTAYVYESGGWFETYGWRNYTPTIYHNLTTTRSVLSGTTIHWARYLRRGHTVFVELDITCGNASSNGVSVSLPATAERRHYACGVGGIYGGSAPTQTGVATMAPGPPYDSIMFTTFSNAFVSAPAAHVIRCSVIYEANVGGP